MIVVHPTYIDISHEKTAFADGEQSNIFTHLYEQFQRKIYNHVYRLLTNPQDAEDVTQEVFLRAHKKWHTLYDRNNLLPWLYLVATNLSIDLLRQRPRISSYISISDQYKYDDENLSHTMSMSIVDETYGSERSITSIAEREHIYLALTRMPRRYAQVLLLNAAQGIPYQEIAHRLDVSPSAAVACITRAKKRFTQEYRHILAKNERLENGEKE